MDRKVLLLVGMLVILAAGAFVYLDPMDLNLLGLKQEPAVATHPAAPAAHPPAAAPMAVVAPPHAAPVAAAVHAPAPPVAAISAAASETEEPAAAKPAAAPIHSPLPPMKPSKMTKADSKPAIDKPMRPKNLDLRHCLELETDAAIAKCAGE